MGTYSPILFHLDKCISPSNYVNINGFSAEFTYQFLKQEFGDADLDYSEKKSCRIFSKELKELYFKAFNIIQRFKRRLKHFKLVSDIEFYEVNETCYLHKNPTMLGRQIQGVSTLVKVLTEDLLEKLSEKELKSREAKLKKLKVKEEKRLAKLPKNKYGYWDVTLRKKGGVEYDKGMEA